MQDSSFKKAEMIELHDCGVVIHHTSYADGLVGWHTYPSEGEVLSVDGESLDHLCQHLGLPVKPIYYENEGMGTTPPCRMRRDLAERKFPLLQKERFVMGFGRGDDRDVKELWAKVRGPNHLELLVEFLFPHGNDTEQQRISYSGAFTVWWAADNNQDKPESWSE
jgi:hypothetical protein